MNKKLLITLIILVVAGIGYYLVSPLWNNKELNEASPLSVSAPADRVTINDDLDAMTPEMKQKFEQETIAMSDKAMVMNDSMPERQARIVAQADFQPRAHDVAGTALLIEQNGQHIVRFENFETINGPDVDIYLATELGDDDFVSLGDLKATKGNVNYAVPAGTDITKYNKVLVWCRAFSVLFSYAELR